MGLTEGPKLEYVAYYRVSTEKQGESGLGLTAQSDAVNRFAKGRNGKILASFREIESGGKDDRPQLLLALDKCKKTGATLLIAKLDRLARSLSFIVSLQESEVKFVACDMPEANEMMIQIMATFAQHERKAISQRSKDALAVVRRDGSKSGLPIGRPPGYEVSEATKGKISESKRGRGVPIDATVKSIIKTMLDDDATDKQITDYLRRLGTRAPKGGLLHQKQVSRWIKRILAE